MQFFRSRTKRPFFWLLIGFGVVVVVGSALATWKLTQPCLDKSQKRVWGSCYRDLQARPLTIGIVNVLPEQNYQPLATHLQKQFGIPVEIDSTPFSEISKRIARKDWDIAFTISPVFSVAAEDNNYLGVALMFPDLPYYRTALFVRGDSPVQSIADIKPTTTIALGGPESVPYFQLPIYALYGKSLRIGKGYTPIEAIEAVRARKVDVSSGLFYDAVEDNPTLKAITVKDDPDLRIIYVSRAIPNAGIYLSPKLASRDRERIKAVLLDAPPEIQAKASYSDRPIPKYDELRRITARTAEILECPSLNPSSFDLKNPINLYCRDPNVIAGQFKLDLTGQVTEYKLPTPGSVEFKVVSAGQVYHVSVPRQILNQIPINPPNAVDKSVQLNSVEARKLADGTWKVQVTQPDQLALLN